MSQMEVHKMEDKEMWDRFVSESPQGSIFCRTDLMDAYGIDYELWGLTKKGEMLAGVPIFDKKDKAVSPLLFCYYQGFILAPHVQALSAFRRPGWLENIFQTFMENLTSHYPRFNLSLHYSLDDLRGLDWFNYGIPGKSRVSLVPRYTAICDLERFENIDDFIKTVRKDRRQDLRYGQEEMLTAGFSTDADELVELYKMTFARNQSAIDDATLALIRRLVCTAINNDFGELVVIRTPEGEPVSAQLYYWDHRSGHAAIQGNHPQYLQHGACSMVYVEFIKRCLEKGLAYADFNGANSPNRADYKHSFNAETKLFFNAAWHEG